MVSRGVLLALLVSVAVANAALLKSQKTTDALGGWREATRHMADVLLKGSSTVGEYDAAVKAVVDATNQHSALKTSLTTHVMKLSAAAERLPREQPDAVCEDATAEHIEDAFIAFLTAAQTNGNCQTTDDPEDTTRGVVTTKCRLSPFDCEHGSVLSLDEEPCTCRCKDSWEGEKCNLCKIADKDCNTGKADTSEGKCECVCSAPWEGTNCESCTLEDCGHGEVDTDCTCKCNEGWGGDSCKKCVRDDTYCHGRGKINAETCECDCTEETQYLEVHAKEKIDEGGADFMHNHVEKDILVWKGKTCQECNLNEKKNCNGFALSAAGCNCQCPENQWDGIACNMCKLSNEDCGNGAKLNGDTCTCSIGCPKEFSTNKVSLDGGAEEEVKGDIFCKACTIHETECKNRSKLDRSSCHCVNLDEDKPRWGGTYYDKCTLKDDQCLHNGRADTTTCECHSCDEGWGGIFCDSCVIDKADVCPNGKSIPDMNNCKCECLGGWSGAHCDACNLECQNGGTLNKEKCECECDAAMAWVNDADENAKKVCNVCDTNKLNGCNNRGEINEATCQCEKCQGYSTGLRCETCNIKADSCKHSGRFSEDACACTCDDEWETALCEKCSLVDAKCGNHARVDRKLCRCSIDCPEKFSNFEKDIHCKTCDVEAVKEKAKDNYERLDAESCKLTCKKHRTGEFCEECTLTDADCGLGGKADRNTCTCSCEKGWAKNGEGKCSTCQLAGLCNAGIGEEPGTCSCKCDTRRNEGTFCEKCKLNENSCFNGGTLNRDNCSCNCKAGFQGPLCNDCDAKCAQNGGTCVNGLCRCPITRTGKNCEMPTINVSNRCRSVGDPHPNTFDGLFYNYYGGGEFIMFKNTQNEKYQVNVIYEPQGAVAWTSGVALKFRMWNDREKSYKFHTFSTYRSRRGPQGSGCCLDGKKIQCSNAALPAEISQKFLIRDVLNFDFQKGNSNFNVDTKNWDTYVQASKLPQKYNGISGICMPPAEIRPHAGNVPHHLFNPIRVDKANSLFVESCWGNLQATYSPGMMELDELDHMSATALATSEGEARSLDEIVAQVLQEKDTGQTKACSADPADGHSFQRLVEALRFCSNTRDIFKMKGHFEYCDGLGERDAKLTGEAKNCDAAGVCKNSCDSNDHEAGVAFRKFVCTKGMATQCPAEDSFKTIADCVADACFGGMSASSNAKNYSTLVAACAARVKKSAHGPVSEWTDEKKCVTKQGMIVEAVEEKP